MNWLLREFIGVLVTFPLLYFFVKNRQEHQKHTDFIAHIKSLSRVHDTLADDTNSRLDAAHTDVEADAVLESFRVVSKAITSEMNPKTMDDNKHE